MRVPSDPESNARDIARFLQQFVASPGSEGPYVHSRAISWISGAQRDHWKRFLADAGERSTVSDFARARHGRATWIGFIDMPFTNYMGQTKTFLERWDTQC
jgi:hypothetical protein